ACHIPAHIPPSPRCSTSTAPSARSITTAAQYTSLRVARILGLGISPCRPSRRATHIVRSGHSPQRGIAGGGVQTVAPNSINPSPAPPPRPPRPSPAPPEIAQRTRHISEPPATPASAAASPPPPARDTDPAPGYPHAPLGFSFFRLDDLPPATATPAHSQQTN